MKKMRADGKREPEGKLIFWLRLLVRALAPVAGNLTSYSFSNSVLRIPLGIAVIVGMFVAADFDEVHKYLQRRKAHRLAHDNEHNTL
jgi:hypothetical protein